MLFGLEASRAQAAKLASRLAIPLSAHEEREFEDREFKIRPLESVRGADVAVYHSLYSDPTASAADKLCRLLFFIGALKDASARSVTAVVPYLAFSRKDRRTKARDPITLRYVAQLFEAVGTDAVVTAEAHNVSAFENAFRCVKESVSCASEIAGHFFRGTVADAQALVVLSPDAGGMKRARAFADVLAESVGRDVSLAFMEKYRSEGRISGGLFAGDVEGATVIIIDDMICGGSTMARAARAARAGGAAAVHAAATHGLFGGDAAAVLGDDIDSIVVTDTAGDVRSRCPALGDKLVVLESAEPLAASLAREGVQG